MEKSYLLRVSLERLYIPEAIIFTMIITMRQCNM
jgi:hypothetical protein